MTKYHKIQSIWKRTDRGVCIPHAWSRPELGYLSELEWEFTEKVDGTNIRIGLELVADGPRSTRVRLDYFVAGRTDNAQLHPKLAAAIADLDLESKLHEHFGNDDETEVVLYGEGYGVKIQSGGKYRQDQGFVLFDVRVGPWWLDRGDVEDVAEKLGLDVVPIVGHGTLDDAIQMVHAGEQRSTWGDFVAEGVVCKPAVQLFNRKGDRIICKVKWKDFLRLRREGIDFLRE